MENWITLSLREKLATAIYEIDLGVRADNCLATAGIKTLLDLVKCSDGELLSLRFFGETTLRNVDTKLKQLGLSRGMSTIDPQESAPKSLRDEFAMAALISMVAGPGARMVADRDNHYDGETNWKEVVALNAYEFADAMMDARKPKEPKA